MEKPLRLELNGVKRFADLKGVLLSSINEDSEFIELRKIILATTKFAKEQFLHLTLMHPRNSTCTETIFAKINKYQLPPELFFSKISVIEQNSGGKWNLINEFNILNKNDLQ